MKYQAIKANQIETAAQVEAMIAQVVKLETGAVVEVTISGQMTIYTEDLDKVEAVKELFSKTRTFDRESHYAADDSLPAGATLSFHI